MNQILKEYLRANEVICWESEPENFTVLDGSTKKGYTVKLLIAAVIAGVVIGGHLASGGTVRPGVIALALAVVVAVAISPFWQKNRVMKTRFWITDQRVIIMGTDEQAKSMELDEIDAFRVVADGRAKKCLVLGSIVFKDTGSEIRWRSVNPKMEEEAGGRKDHALGMILYNAENVEGAVAILKKAGCAQAA